MKLPITQPHSKVHPNELDPCLIELLKQIAKQVKGVRFETMRTIKTIKVFLGWEPVGEVSYGYHERRIDGEPTPLYSVESSRYIHNHKSPYNAKVSKSIRLIVKECVRVLKNTPSDSVADSVYNSMVSDVKNILSDQVVKLQTNVIKTHELNLDSKECIAFVLSCYKTWIGQGSLLPPTISEGAKEKISDALQSYEVAIELLDYVKKGEGYYVRIEDDETVNVSSGDGKVLMASTKEFAELPEMVQMKLTLLKLQDKSGVIIKSVGVAVTKCGFFIADCEMEHLV